MLSNCEAEVKYEDHLDEKQELSTSLDIFPDSPLCLSQIEFIISDTYDRKQREILKAIHKIKSIILNHAELQQILNYYENSLFESM